MPFAMSDYLESGLFNHVLRTATFTKPTTVAIALCSNVPQEFHTGATIPELPNAGGYARIPHASGDVTWSHIAHGSGANISTLSFPQASANWGNVSGVALVDSSTYGAGNMLMYGQLVTPRTVLSGDTFQFNANNVTIVFD